MGNEITNRPRLSQLGASELASLRRERAESLEGQHLTGSAMRLVKEFTQGELPAEAVEKAKRVVVAMCDPLGRSPTIDGFEGDDDPTLESSSASSAHQVCTDAGRLLAVVYREATALPASPENRAAIEDAIRQFSETR
ncbi:MAG: hypothetical protein HY901_02545 [Deltaproteobacteria bacterium]|nr:hypothetical protein [Deltaproteobacteria bacterium]